MEYTFETTQWLPVDLNQAWDFFTSPANLGKITPPAMDFRIITNDLPSKIRSGLIIEYTVKPLFGIKCKWVTEINNVEEPLLFTDIQIKGPYKRWEHRHTFIEKDGGVLMTDFIHYELYGGLAARWLHGILIRPELQSIFNYRRATLNILFPS